MLIEAEPTVESMSDIVLWGAGPEDDDLDDEDWDELEDEDELEGEDLDDDEIEDWGEDDEDGDEEL
jgi:hypothetical protein